MIETLYKFGHGRPRLLNTLADNALFEAYLAGRNTIDPSDVERAAGDLGVGPDPGSTFTQNSMSAPPAASPTARNMSTSEPAAEFELTLDMASEIQNPPVATGDLDAGLEAALEEIAKVPSISAGVSNQTLGAETFQPDQLPTLRNDKAIVDAMAAPVPRPAASQEPEMGFVLAEEELAPLEASDGDQFDDVFVELIEE